ncbi:MAG: Fur family transcriptional regulator, partial [Muribaculaceae bacterium]
SLRDAHLVTEFNVGEDSHRYDANTSFHPHLICTRCHCVVDYLNPTALESSALSNLRNQIAEKKGFHAEAQEFDIYGICPDCQSKEN